MEYLTTAQVAARLGITADTWRAYVNRGRAPKATRKLGPLNLWSWPVVEAWQATRPGRGRWGRPLDAEATP